MNNNFGPDILEDFNYAKNSDFSDANNISYDINNKEVVFPKNIDATSYSQTKSETINKKNGMQDEIKNDLEPFLDSSGYDFDKMNNNNSKNISLEIINGAENRVKSSDLSPSIEDDTDNVSDILRNGLLIKRIIKKGLGSESRPVYGDWVTIEYKLWNEDDKLLANEECSFVIGEGDMIRAIDLAVCQSERQEVFELETDSEYAYGKHGWLPNVRPGETLRYRITLKSVDDPPDCTMYSPEQRFAAAEKKKKSGDFYLERGEYSYAVNSYSLAIQIVKADPAVIGTSLQLLNDDILDLYFKATRNLALSQLKLELYDDVIESCNTIISYYPNDVKALFWKGKCLYLKRCCSEALPSLYRALDLDPNNKVILDCIENCYEYKRRASKSAPGTGTRLGAEARFRYWPHVGAVVMIGLAVFLARFVILRCRDN